MSDLTDKQRVFVEHYLTCWNATEAARVAGYKGSDRTLAVVGWENLRKPNIEALVQARIAEMAMTADEVLVRLADQARATMDDFVTDYGTVRLDLQKAIKNKKMHLVKKFTATRQGTSVELYDAQAALQLIGKHHGLFTDRVEHSGEIAVTNERERLERRVLDLVESGGTYQVPTESDE